MPHSVLARFDVALLRDNSSTDNRQVPNAGATLKFYGQGATLSGAAAVPAGSSTVTVFDTGDLEAGSTLTVGVDGPALSVTSVDSATEITVSNGGVAMVISTNTRLILTSDRPQFYSDPQGTDALGSDLIADAQGRVTGYISRSRFDYVVPGSALTVAYDATSSTTINGTDSATWSHTTSSGSNRVMLVAVAWSGLDGDETISSVTYNSVAMDFWAWQAPIWPCTRCSIRLPAPIPLS